MDLGAVIEQERQLKVRQLEEEEEEEEEAEDSWGPELKRKSAPEWLDVPRFSSSTLATRLASRSS